MLELIILGYSCW